MLCQWRGRSRDSDAYASAVLDFDKWIRDHTDEPWAEFADLDFRIVERFTTFNLDDNYKSVAPGQGTQINAWFLDDWRPLTSEEINNALKVFHWQRDELLAGYTTLSPEILEMQRPGERWNITGIVKTRGECRTMVSYPTESDQPDA